MIYECIARCKPRVQLGVDQNKPKNVLHSSWHRSTPFFSQAPISDSNYVTWYSISEKGCYYSRYVEGGNTSKTWALKEKERLFHVWKGSPLLDNPEPMKMEHCKEQGWVGNCWWACLQPKWKLVLSGTRGTTSHINNFQCSFSGFVWPNRGSSRWIQQRTEDL